jgi:hypothetical protein
MVCFLKFLNFFSKMVNVNNVNCQELTMEEMEDLVGGGCAGYLAGVIGVVAFAGSPGSVIGLLVAIENASSCGKVIDGFFGW